MRPVASSLESPPNTNNRLPMSRTHESPANREGPYRPGPHWAALMAAAFTWPLLLVGGSVTVYRVGMAVPDWPTTFGVNMFLYDFLNSSWGVYLEHTHRLYGSLVGLACIVLAFWATLAEVRLSTGLAVIAATVASGFLPRLFPGAAPGGLSPFFAGLVVVSAVSLALAAWFGLVRRRWVPALSWFALAAVIGQGVLGGYRVRLNSTDLAFLHGCTAQAFFGLMVVLCVLTGRRWTITPRVVPDTAQLRLHSSITLVLVLSQIALGAWLRHYGTTTALGAHAALAAAVILYSTITGRAARRRRADVPEVAPSARALMACVHLQVLLGVVAWWVLRPFDGIPRQVWPGQAAVRIAHQGVGALLLASAVVLTLRTFRHLGPAPNPPLDDDCSPASASRDLEAVT